MRVNPLTLYFFWKACKCSMACKCFFETREASVCSESSARLIKLSECTGDISDHLRACHLGQLRGTVQEYELIINRSGLPHDLSPDQLEELWICEKHRGNMGKNWRPRRTFQYPLHNSRKKQLNTRNAVHLDMSMEIEGTTAGQPLAIYRRPGRTGDERGVGHVVLKKYLSHFAWTG